MLGLMIFLRVVFVSFCEYTASGSCRVADNGHLRRLYVREVF